jgi:hypothetical protein
MIGNPDGIRNWGFCPNRRPFIRNSQILLWHCPAQYNPYEALNTRGSVQIGENSVDTDSFGKYYEGLTDDELTQVVADRKDLVPEASSALDREVSKRHLKATEPPHWIKTPDSSEAVGSLEDYKQYRELLERKRSFGRLWYFVAIGPMILGLVLGRLVFENSETLVLISLAWAMCVAGYMLFLNIRFLGFRCPQCSQSFGRGSECFNCGFPRASNGANKDKESFS